MYINRGLWQAGPISYAELSSIAAPQSGMTVACFHCQVSAVSANVVSDATCTSGGASTVIATYNGTVWDCSYNPIATSDGTPGYIPYFDSGGNFNQDVGLQYNQPSGQLVVNTLNVTTSTFLFNGLTCSVVAGVINCS